MAKLKMLTYENTNTISLTKSRISEMGNIDRKTLQKHLKELETKGIISISERNIIL
ncbi:cyclic nucleotide-binding domain-containing protein [Acetivibrio cellulolyticus]|uniref:hypothetical protein n=1 Tax=Acetivibrio cellulolyticus TaxID=35830 RepID=UPI0002E3AAC8|nr:hypothetical protein [Acetivibrio cellulolyticus]